MYNVGTVTTTANSTKLIGVGTKWKDNNSRVSAEQVILIQNGSTIYINSIASIQSNTEITLSFPVPAAAKNVPYNILTTMVNSVSDAANKIVAMNNANVQFSDILNRWMTESGTITVTLPDGTTQQLRTAKEMDKQLDGKFDKAGGTVNGRVDAVSTGEAMSICPADGEMVHFAIKNKDGSRAAYLGYGSPANPKELQIINSRGGGNIGIIEGELKINGRPAMRVGDYGFGGSGEEKNLSAPDLIEFYRNTNTPTQVFRNMNGTDPSFAYSVIAYFKSRYSFSAFTASHEGRGVRVIAGNNAQDFIYNLYTDRNTTKDSQGNLKVASPIVKVFADHIELNEESEGVEMEHLGVGHYLIKGVVGFNADGAWGINNGFVIPQDHNGKNMVLIDYEVKPDGDIELFVFHNQNIDMPERFQNKRIKHIDEDGNPVYYENYEPCDVPESRWIDMRVEMPVNSIYNLKQAEAERLAKEEAERQAEEEAKNAEIEAEEDI
ncbi:MULTISPECIES: hypothetical protein [Providencia]|uniref:Phage tail protein C-terminal domain-containing protein n=1 Tax=Providencia vermicola TaxID=333965 RepID=A0AAX3RWW0_9GAMM|nr:hypothetical protein [Providencia vermicola]USB37046.1 hypothetical protein M5J11_00560 [Providencia vermicola]WFC05978.1 hypothetical protein PG365_14905 [Providencia vermicola]